MARIKHTTKIHGAPRAAQKQLNLIKNLKTRMKEKYGVKKMAIKNKSKKVLYVGAPPAAAATAQDATGEKRKHRWKPGTVARREIRKQTRSTNLLFPKSTFCRVIREVCQDKVPHGNEMRFTTNSLKAIQEASENFIVEMFHKSDMARKHSGRETLGVDDIRFSRFMKPDSMWVMPDRMYEKNFFGAVPVSNIKPEKLKLRQEEAAFGKDVAAIEKKLKLKMKASSAASQEAPSTSSQEEGAQPSQQPQPPASKKNKKQAAEDDTAVSEEQPPSSKKNKKHAAEDETPASEQQPKANKKSKAPSAAPAAEEDSSQDDENGAGEQEEEKSSDSE